MLVLKDGTISVPNLRCHYFPPFKKLHKNAVKTAISLDIEMFSNIRHDFESIDRQILQILTPK